MILCLFPWKICFNILESISNQDKIPFDEVMGFIEYMSDHLATDENNLFEDSFIGNLKVIVVGSYILVILSYIRHSVHAIYNTQLIAEVQTKDFCDKFDEITQLLCYLCPKIDSKVTFFNRVLKYWKEMLKCATIRQKYTACLCCANYL